MTTTHFITLLTGLFLATALFALGCGGGDSEEGGDEPAVACPNLDSTGTGVKDQLCAAQEECGCGLFCNGTSGTCQPYEGDFAGCSCENAIPTGDIVETDTAEEDAEEGGEEDTNEPVDDCAKIPPAGSGCNPYCQTGCADEQHCSMSAGFISCMPVGEKGIGEECDSSQVCGTGMACFKLNEEPTQRCYLFCVDNDACPEGRKCDLSVNFGNGQADFCGDVTVGCEIFGNPVPACTPNCIDRQCGDNGCGGTCGECAEGLECSEGALCFDPTVPEPVEEDPNEASISISAGSNTPGCEETNECFNPAEVTILVGGTVTWTNDDTAAHTVTSGEPEEGPNGVFDSGLINAGATFEFTFDTEGSYKYFDLTHPWMTGTITVLAEIPTEEGGDVCEADCEEKACGDDGCGGICGECAEGELCSGTQECIANCTPNCEGLTCGGDGCGGSCGECAEGEVCSESGCATNPCGAGQGCYISNKAAKCMEAGTLGIGETCHGESGNVCMPGLVCQVVCTPLCSTGSDDPSCGDICSGEVKVVSEENEAGYCQPPEAPTLCDLYEQDDCPPGEGCYLVSGGIACIDAGTAEGGEVCEFTNSCAPGMLCVNGSCQEACNAAADATGPHACAEKCDSVANLNPQEWGVGVCQDAGPAIPCEFWAQDCTDGKVCKPVTNGSTCLDPSGNGADGDACNSNTDCAGTLLCISSVCKQACSIDELAPPPAPICVDECPGGFSPVGGTGSQTGVCNE